MDFNISDSHPRVSYTPHGRSVSLLGAFQRAPVLPAELSDFLSEEKVEVQFSERSEESLTSWARLLRERTPPNCTVDNLLKDEFSGFLAWSEEPSNRGANFWMTFLLGKDFMDWIERTAGSFIAAKDTCSLTANGDISWGRETEDVADNLKIERIVYPVLLGGINSAHMGGPA